MLRTMVAVLALVVASQAQASADVTTQGLSIGGVKAALLMPAKPKGAIILMAGGDGRIGVRADGTIAKQGNQLVRTRKAYAERGFAVLVPEGDVDVQAAIRLMRKHGPVTVVGTSRGTQRAARAIAAGAKPDRLVLTAGFLSDASGDTDNVINILGSPARLPPTLVVHHRSDQCRKTRPAGVAPFIAWAKGKARVVWLAGGRSSGRFCGARAHHGFAGIDASVVESVAGFAAR